MPDMIPFTPSDNNYRLSVSLGDTKYLFDVYWNARDLAWYFDLLQDDETPIAYGIKVVLGVSGGLGARSQDPFFTQHRLTAIDTSGQDIDAAYDDLGARIVVVHRTQSELLFGDNPTAT